MPIPLDSDLMRTFLAMSETGSVTAAAEKVGRTQSAVSMQLRRLEETLGQRLFDRRPRGVELTARGTQLMPYARRVVRLLDEAAVALRERPLTGPVRIGIPDEYSETVLPHALAAFTARHPAVEVTVRVEHSAPQMAALEADLVDIAVIFEPGRSARGELLCIDPTVWVTSVAQAQHRRRPLPVTGYFQSDWCKQYAMGSLERQGWDYRLAFECDTSAGFRTAVRTGLAIAPLSRSTIPEGCRELTAEEGFPSVDSTCVVMHRNPRGTSPAIEGLAAMLREAFRPLGGAEAEAAAAAAAAEGAA